MRLYEQKVGAAYVVATTERELARAVAAVKRGEPLLGSNMRAKGSKTQGEVVQVDKAKRTARLQWREPTPNGRAIVLRHEDFAWSRLVVA